MERREIDQTFIYRDQFRWFVTSYEQEFKICDVGVNQIRFPAVVSVLDLFKKQ